MGLLLHLSVSHTCGQCCNHAGWPRAVGVRVKRLFCDYTPMSMALKTGEVIKVTCTWITTIFPYSFVSPCLYFSLCTIIRKTHVSTFSKPDGSTPICYLTQSLRPTANTGWRQRRQAFPVYLMPLNRPFRKRNLRLYEATHHWSLKICCI